MPAIFSEWPNKFRDQNIRYLRQQTRKTNNEDLRNYFYIPSQVPYIFYIVPNIILKIRIMNHGILTIQKSYFLEILLSIQLLSLDNLTMLNKVSFQFINRRDFHFI